ncbi:limbic system-associated membrane protein isoform X1 [Bemisia tabaci]|uniref:limbic system-associated membrane protein isoform X1 n=1 Tax=Bemisia tabaci TaxID=7038 RepID=UPI0008F9C2B9|nr:PREDICTED: netrin receptor DCC-like [Bemisia tabaci]XP_018907866.1 PREDICTED: netrin receptor DCC-like [Bemisia tabaci]
MSFSIFKLLELKILGFFLIGRWTVDALQLTPSNKYVEKRVNDSYVVECYGKGAEDYAWIGPSGSRIPNSDSSHRIRVEEGRDSLGMRGPHLMFEHIMKSDMGEYKCSARMQGQPVSISFKLNVIKPISFGDTPNHVDGTPGNKILLPCKVDGEPNLSIHWQFQGQQITDPKYTVVDRGLEITNPTLENAGEYQCRALQMQTGDFNFHKIILRLKHKPMWTSNDSVIYGYVHGTADLNCAVSAEPAPIFDWYRNNRQVKPVTDLHSINTYSVGNKHISTLKIKIVDKSAFGDYKCKVTNPLGTISKVFVLKEGVKPPKPEKVQLLQYGSNFALLDIQRPLREDTVLGYRVEYIEGKKDNSSKRWLNAKLFNFDKHPPGSPSEYRLTNLTEDTWYELRVASRNEAGISEFAFLDGAFKTTPAATSSVSTLVFNVMVLLPAIVISFVCRA